MSTVPSATTTSGTTSPASSNLLSSTDFLQILVAEFKGQDPTSPTDPTQFASQLVQFANLGQLQSIDNAVQPQASTTLMQAASAFIGREVVTPGNTIGVLSGKATSITWTPANTDTYSAQIINSAGQQVDSVTLCAQNAGALNTFTWSPPSGNGDGQYTVNIVDSKGATVSGTLEQGIVQSVAMTSAGVTVDLGNLQIAESQIESVAQPQTSN